MASLRCAESLANTPLQATTLGGRSRAAAALGRGSVEILFGLGFGRRRAVAPAVAPAACAGSACGLSGSAAGLGGGRASDPAPPVRSAAAGWRRELRRRHAWQRRNHGRSQNDVKLECSSHPPRAKPPPVPRHIISWQDNNMRVAGRDPACCHGAASGLRRCGGIVGVCSLYTHCGSRMRSQRSRFCSVRQMRTK